MSKFPPARRTSEILNDIITNGDDGYTTLGAFIDKLGDRAFALAILLFSLPNSLPFPGIPGFSTITGLPIAFIALQLIAGRDTFWLPYKVASKQFSQAKLKKVLSKALPAVIWLERYLMPRLDWACQPICERFYGVMFLVLALIISLPIPGGNFLPGLAMSLIALGMLERDGLFILCALGFAVVAIVLMYEFIALFFRSVGKWMGF